VSWPTTTCSATRWTTTSTRRGWCASTRSTAATRWPCAASGPRIGEGGKRSAEPLAEAQGLAPFKLEEWHEYDLTCVGNRLTLKVNGRLVAEATDSDPVHFAAQGILALQLHTGPATVAQFKDIRLKILKPAVVRAAAPAEQKPSGDGQPLRDKTLVVWAAPANLTQRGGSALTIDDSQSHFDGLVFAERAPAKWMAGSDHYRRSDLKQDAWPAETADANTFVQMAAVYRGNELTVFRNGKEYERHAVKEPQLFGPESLVLIGPRHLGNGDCFAGAVDDARLYDRALTPGELAALKPNESGGMGDSPMRGDPSKLPAPHIKPWAWWTFEGGACKDLTGRFAAARLTGGAKVENGCLVLDGAKAAFCAARTDEALGGFPGGALPPSLAYKPDLPGDIAVARRFRNHLLADPYRPTYHFVIPEDYAGPFDPNGAIFWRGQYHLFYIYQENRAHCFGHVSSVDMVHWRQHPTPLYPTAESVDRVMFSGNCFVNREGEATMLVHGVGAGNCIFTSTDDNLDRWSRCRQTPSFPPPKETSRTPRGIPTAGSKETPPTRSSAARPAARSPRRSSRPRSSTAGATPVPSCITRCRTWRRTKTFHALTFSRLPASACWSASRTTAARATTSASGRTSSSRPKPTRA
jgi:hypothetical protein